MVISLNREQEDELCRRLSMGDREAFRQLFDNLNRDVFRLSYSMVYDRQTAEDVSQEAFIRLWRHAPSWKNEKNVNVKTWLLTVARNLCIDAIRKRKNDNRKNENIHENTIPFLDVSGIIEEGLDREKHERILNHALFSLPERQREAVVLVYYTEVGNAEAARIMGINSSAFDSLLARARRNLREELRHDQEDLKSSYINGTH